MGEGVTLSPIFRSNCGRFIGICGAWEEWWAYGGLVVGVLLGAEVCGSIGGRFIGPGGGACAVVGAGACRGVARDSAP